MKWQVISMILPLEDLLKKSEVNSLFFSEKVCIKECLEIEKTQVICCGHPQNIYFMLNSTTASHCGTSIYWFSKKCNQTRDPQPYLLFYQATKTS
jgi:hypothetical protein